MIPAALIPVVVAVAERAAREAIAEIGRNSAVARVEINAARAIAMSAAKVEALRAIEEANRDQTK